jgi:hypothetical protein
MFGKMLVCHEIPPEKVRHARSRTYAHLVMVAAGLPRVHICVYARTYARIRRVDVVDAGMWMLIRRSRKCLCTCGSDFIHIPCRHSCIVNVRALVVQAFIYRAGIHISCGHACIVQACIYRARMHISCRHSHIVQAFTYRAGIHTSYTSTSILFGWTRFVQAVMQRVDKTRVEP